jgi:hypothetical protein
VKRSEPAGSLSRFQRAFVHALLAEAAPADPAVAALVAQPAFAVYRNTVMKGCIDALQANFPSVARLVGDDWFRAAASVYVRLSPPNEPSLLRYGAAFPAFLAAFKPAVQLPYLAGVARLDRLWTEAHVAADAPALDAADLARLDPEALAGATLHPHPAARWAWFPDSPVHTIWQRNRGDSTDESEIDWRGEGALLTRAHDHVRERALDAAGCRFLEACAQGVPVAQALDAALDADANTNLVRMVAQLVDAGAFERLSHACDNNCRKERP